MAKDTDKIIADQTKEIASLKKQLARKQEQEAAAQDEIVDYTKELIALDKQRLDYLREISMYNDMIVDAEKEIKKAAGDSNKIKRKQLTDLQDETKKAIKVARLKEAEKANEKKILIEKQKQVKLNKELRDIQDKYTDEIENSLGFIDDIGTAVSKIPVVGGLLAKSLGLDEIKKSITNNLTKTLATALQTGQLNAAGLGSTLMSSFKTGIAGARALMVSLGPLLPILIAIGVAMMAFKKALELDQEITDMARGLGISREEAEGLHNELIGVAATTKVVGADSAELSKSFMQLAKDMGDVSLVTAQMAESQVLLTKQYELAGEEASEFQKIAMMSGRTAEQNVAAIQGITREMAGGMMNYKDVMKDIAGTSKAVQATFKGNIGQLTKAVITARKFGKTLDDVKKITDGLLDIEGSIEKEMQARVLTGKDMNFDLARSLKLRGKETEALEEIYKQAGGYSELMSMAPYQLEATAEAAGMTVDELMKGAEQQQMFNDMSQQLGRTIKNSADLREEDLKLLQGQTAQQAKALVLEEQRNSASERMAALGDRLMTIFTKLAVPLMEMLDPLMQMTEDLFPVLKISIGLAFAPLKIVLNTIKLMVDAIKLLWDAISWVGSAINTYLGDPLGFVYDKIKAITDFFGKIGDKISGFWGGIKSFVANRGETKPTALSDGMIAPDGGLMVAGAKGTYQLDKQDKVVAMTDDGSSNSSTNNASMSELVGLMKELLTAVKQPAIVQIGNKVVNEIDRIQSMNRSYVGKVDNSYGAV